MFSHKQESNPEMPLCLHLPPLSLVDTSHQTLHLDLAPRLSDAGTATLNI